MKIISKTITTIIFLVISSILVISLIASVYMYMIEEETSDRTANLLIDEEERKLLDLSLQKSDHTHSILNDMVSISEVIGSTVSSYYGSYDIKDGYIEKSDEHFIASGDFSGDMECMLSGRFRGKINCSFGVKDPYAETANGERIPGNWSFISGSISGYCDAAILIPEGNELIGTLNGREIHYESIEREIAGQLNVSISGSEEMRDSGILISGHMDGFIDGTINGPIGGFINGTIHSRCKGKAIGEFMGQYSEFI